MMDNTNKEWVSMSDKSIIASIGQYLKHQRLKQNKTAGVNRWTMSQAENGEAISLTSLIQILRALDLLHVLDQFKIASEISPLELAKLEKQKRQRARNNENDQEKQSEW